MEHQAHDNALEKKAISRRQLLKALVAAGGAITASTLLPGEWAKPVVEVGVLPAHAQASAPTPTPTPTPTVAPTPLPHAIVSCSASDSDGDGAFRPTDTIVAFATISPADAGIELRRTITLDEVGHPDNGVLDIDTGFTDTSGRFLSPDYSLSALTPNISLGVDRIVILWEFVNSADGTGTCTRNLEIV